MLHYIEISYRRKSRKSVLIIFCQFESHMAGKKFEVLRMRVFTLVQVHNQFEGRFEGCLYFYSNFITEQKVADELR